MKSELEFKGTVDQAWIQTFTGKRFNVFKPDPEQIDIIDIAHALSMCVRFNGHLPHFYSVAEHSYLMSLLVDKDMAKAALLHDAAEAYISDMPRPIKYQFPAIKEIDALVTDAICEKFGIAEIPEEVHLMDRRMCLTEAKRCGMNTDAWELENSYDSIADLSLYFWDWKKARELFFNRFMEVY